MSKAKKSKSPKAATAKGKKIVHRDTVDPIPESDVPEIQVEQLDAPPIEAPAAEEPKPAKTKRGRRAATSAPKVADAAPKALSCLDAAAAVLQDRGVSMRCKDLIDLMASAGLWSSTAPTPAATLSSAILREITTKGEASRFLKADRGLFARKP